MKDLEKIKSEDLAAQVQDANPANFAIEQEVAQLVGATVPAPTEPSADDARELGAQLLVFLRRALTPIQTALRTALAAIYAHLDSRCTDYTPAGYASFTPTHHAYDPMGSTPRTLPNLLTALTAFSARKISNGGAGIIADGMTITHLLCDSSAANLVTELKDDNTPWVFNRSGYIQTLAGIFANAEKITMRCSSITQPFWPTTNSEVTRALDIFVYDCKSIVMPSSYMALFTSSYGNTGFPNFRLWIYGLEDGNNVVNHNRGLVVGELHLPDFKRNTFCIGGWASYYNSYLKRMYVGCKGSRTDTITISIVSENNTSVEDFFIGDYDNISKGLAPRWIPRQSINVSQLQGLTAENIVNHIFEKLADNSDGDPITINIGSTNLAKLTDEQKAIAQNKNYTLA